MRIHLLKVMLLLVLCNLAASIYAAKCRVNTVPLDFGIYYPMQTQPLEITGGVDIDCRGKRGTYQLSASTGVSGSFSDRYMQMDMHILKYNLFTNAARTSIFGDGTGNSTVVTGFHLRGRTRETINIFGEIYASQNPDPGLYIDVITVTITF